MHIDDPLASPWATARGLCLWTILLLWPVIWINSLTARIDWIGEVALNVIMIAVLAVLPVHLLGRRKLERQSKAAEQGVKEMDRLRHLGQ